MNPLMSLLLTVILSCRGAGEESNYEGKTLSQWTAQTQHDSNQSRQQAAHALAVIVMRSQDAAAATALTRLLQDEDVGVRDCAFRELWHAARTLNRPWPAAKDAIPALAKLAAQGGTRTAAIGALGCMGSEAVPALIELAAQTGVSERRLVVLVLSKIGSERAKEIVPFLMALLDDPDQALRQNAISALGGMGAEGKVAIPTLLKLLRDESPPIRSAAGSSLSVIGRAAPRDVLAALTPLALDPNVQVRQNVVLALSRTEAKEAIPVFLQSLADDDQAVRDFAVWGLGGLASKGDKEVVPVLAHLLQDKDSRIRFWAAKTLGAADPESLWEAVRDQGPAIRAEAASGLGRHWLSTALPTLRKFVQDKDPVVQAAVQAAAARGRRVATLESLAQDQDPDVRSWAARTLTAVEQERQRTIETLSASHRQADWDKANDMLTTEERRAYRGGGKMQAVRKLQAERQAAREAAAREEDAAREARRAGLIRAFQDSDPKVRRTAACDVVFYEPAAAGAMPLLLEALSDPDLRLKASTALVHMGPAAKEAVPALVELLQDANPSVRAQAVGALEAIGSATPAVASALAKALQHEDGELRNLAAVALGRIGPSAQAAVPVLVQSLKDPVPAVRAHAARALGRLGPLTPATVVALTTALHDEEQSVRFAAIDALASLGPAAKDAIPPLEQATQDPNCFVRWNATRALKKIRP